MYVVDMHCDSLLAVSGDAGLINPYNFSNKYPHVQFVAEFCPKANEPPRIRRNRLIRMLDLYLYECERLGISKIKTVKDLLNSVNEGRRCSILTLEGGGGIFADSEELSVLSEAGLLVMGMAWDGNELCASAFCDDDTGLSDEGKKLCRKAEALGIILDVSHLSDRAFYDTLEYYRAPVLATHSNFREICNSKRNLTRDMALRIAERGGVIGLNLYPPFLNESKMAGFEDIYRHIDYGLELLGEDSLGFGFDIDGVGNNYPHGISLDRSIHDQVVDKLLSRYHERTVEKIAGENVIEFLKNNMLF